MVTVLFTVTAVGSNIGEEITDDVAVTCGVRSPDGVVQNVESLRGVVMEGTALALLVMAGFLHRFSPRSETRLASRMGTHIHVDDEGRGMVDTLLLNGRAAATGLLTRWLLLTVQEALPSCC